MDPKTDPTLETMMFREAWALVKPLLSIKNVCKAKESVSAKQKDAIIATEKHSPRRRLAYRGRTRCTSR